MTRRHSRDLPYNRPAQQPINYTSVADAENDELGVLISRRLHDRFHRIAETLHWSHLDSRRSA
jgi:hypothetical protein